MVARCSEPNWRQLFLALIFTLVVLNLDGATAYAAVGDILKSFTPSPSGNGRAVAFDPGAGRLYYTLTNSSSIFITDANNTRATAINPGVLCGALTWDVKRNALWCGSYNGTGNVYTINPQIGQAIFRFTFTPTEDSCYGPFGTKNIDGLAYDEGPTFADSDDSVWLSCDAARTVYHVTLSGSIIGSFTVPNNPRSENSEETV